MPTIVLEGHSNLAIWKALLPEDLFASCEILATEGRSTPVSVARTHLIKHHAPIVLVFDTDTLNPTMITETVQTTLHLMSAVAGSTPYDVIYCVPHLEVVFFEASIDLQGIFPKLHSAFIPQFAKTQPKDQLTLLFEKGGGPKDLQAFLDTLTSDDIEKLRATKPVQRLITFIANNRTPVAPRR
jgi:hypothetical protein